MDTAPKASGCILGGTQRVYREEPGKQKTRSPPGAGIIPKPCPRKGVAEMKTKDRTHGLCESDKGIAAVEEGEALVGRRRNWGLEEPKDSLTRYFFDRQAERPGELNLAWTLALHSSVLHGNTQL